MCYCIKMARPIKPTPILKGKDAERFETKINYIEPEPKETMERAKSVYERFKSIANFMF